MAHGEKGTSFQVSPNTTTVEVGTNSDGRSEKDALSAGIASGPQYILVIILAVVLFLLWGQLVELFKEILERIKKGAAVDIGPFRLGALDVSREEDWGSDSLGSRENADKFEELVNKRRIVKKEDFDLNLVHFVRKTERKTVEGWVYFDAYISIKSHENKISPYYINEVKYFFGSHFGPYGKRGEGPGTVYIVRDKRNSFAIKIDLYGPTLCVAEISLMELEPWYSTNENRREVQKRTVYVTRYIDFGIDGADLVREQDLGTRERSIK